MFCTLRLTPKEDGLYISAEAGPTDRADSVSFLPQLELHLTPRTLSAPDASKYHANLSQREKLSYHGKLSCQENLRWLPRKVALLWNRGLHSSTSQLNLSRF